MNHDIKPTPSDDTRLHQSEETMHQHHVEDQATDKSLSTPAPLTPTPFPENPVISYAVRAGPGNTFTTDPVFGNSISPEQLNTDVAFDTGVDPAICAQVIRALASRLVGYTQNGMRVPNIGDQLQFRPTTGGSSLTPSFNNAKELNLNMSISALPPIVQNIQQNTGISQNRTRGKKQPVISTVFMVPDKTLNVYSLTKMDNFKGEMMLYDPSDLRCGFFWASILGGPWVRSTMIGMISNTLCQAQPPAGVVGPQNVSLVVKVGDEYRIVTYGVQLNVATLVVAAEEPDVKEKKKPVKE